MCHPSGLAQAKSDKDARWFKWVQVLEKFAQICNLINTFQLALDPRGSYSPNLTIASEDLFPSLGRMQDADVNKYIFTLALKRPNYYLLKNKSK